MKIASQKYDSLPQDLNKDTKPINKENTPTQDENTNKVKAVMKPSTDMDNMPEKSPQERADEIKKAQENLAMHGSATPTSSWGAQQGWETKIGKMQTPSQQEQAEQTAAQKPVQKDQSAQKKPWYKFWK